MKNKKLVYRAGKTFLFFEDDFQEENLAPIEEAIADLRSTSSVNGEVRSSRGAAKALTLPTGEKLLLRKYMRGGMLSLVNSASFFKLPTQKSRAENEFDILLYLLEKGISVPKPRLVILEEKLGGFLYQAYIAFDFLDEFDNFLVKAIKTSSKLSAEMEKAAYHAGQEAKKMLGANVFHVDLHPGNVMFNQSSGELKLIDFDKAHYSKSIDREEKLFSRWDRSIRKHGLPGNLSSAFKEGILA